MKEYPFTLPKDRINYFKEYRKNFNKCIAVIQSKNKKKVKGKVVNIFMPEYARNGKKGIIITIEYKTKENVLKVGECYMDFPNTYPALNEETDIFYVDDNYDFVYIDDLQYIDRETYIDSKKKLDEITKEYKPVIISVLLCLILSLVAISSMNSYLILVSTVVQFILLFVNLRTVKKPIVFIHSIVYFLNLIGIIIYSANNIINLDLGVYITYVLHLIFVIILFIFSKTKSNKKSNNQKGGI